MFFKKEDKINDLEQQKVYLQLKLEKEEASKKELANMYQELKERNIESEKELNRQKTKEVVANQIANFPSPKELRELISKGKKEREEELEELLAKFMPTVTSIITAQAEAGKDYFILKFSQLYYRMEPLEDFVKLIESYHAKVQEEGEPFKLYEVESYGRLSRGEWFRSPAVEHEQANTLKIASDVIAKVGEFLENQGYTVKQPTGYEEAEGIMYIYLNKNQ